MMWRRNASVAALFGLCLAGCAGLPRWVRGVGEAGGTARVTQDSAAQNDLTRAEARVRELEDRLAEREREIAAARDEIASLRSTAESEGQSRSGPGSSEATVIPPTGDRSAATSEAEREARLEAERAKRQLSSVEAQLGRERRRRKVLEQDLANLREETSSSPFERQREASLGDTRDQIARLKRELAAQKAEREELTRRYATLQAQVEASKQGGHGEDPRPDPAPFESEQTRILDELRRDLAASRASEEQLRAELNSRSQGADAVPASEVQRLAAENSALQTRLAEERQVTQELAAKLKAAMRVTDLIFKMQGGSPGARPPETQR